jgi:Rod binding domain-containing protein
VDDLALTLATQHVTGSVPARAADDPAKIRDAAQQFEALLLSEMLRSERESGHGWLGTGGDATGECATDFAEQQLGVALAQRGGLGLAGLISSGLKKAR